MDASPMHLWRRLIDISKNLRDISKKAYLQISNTSPGRLIKEVSSETSLRSLMFSQSRLWVASETAILGLQIETFFGYLFIYYESFAKLIYKVAQSLFLARKLSRIFVHEKKLFRPNGSSAFPLSFLELIISKTFSYALLRKIWLVQLKEGFRVSSVKTYSNWQSKTPDHDYTLVRSCKLFCSSVTLLWYVQWYVLSFSMTWKFFSKNWRYTFKSWASVKYKNSFWIFSFLSEFLVLVHSSL